jgi:putative nucleotidyltransferase with HDIG domain
MGGEGDKLATSLEKIVVNRVATGRLVLPPLAAAGRCLAILRDPDFKVRKLVEQLETEPLLALRVMGDANAASFSGGAVRGLELAVTRVGAQRLKNMMIEHSAQELFRSSDRKVADANIKIWEHSLAVAILARDIAALVGNSDPEGCYAAGLLHDIGKPVIAAILSEVERKSVGKPGIDAATWQRVVDATHRPIGVAIATEWKLPVEIGSAIRDCSDYDAGDRGSIANVVRLANAAAKREGYVAGAIDAADVDAMIMVGTSMLGADEKMIGRLSANLRSRLPAGASS